MTGLSRTVIELLPYYGFKLVLQNCDKNVSSVRARSPYLPLSHHRIKTDDISCARYRKKCSAQGVLSCQHKSASVATVSDGKQEIKSGCADVRGNPLQYFGFAPINLKRYVRSHGLLRGSVVAAQCISHVWGASSTPRAPAVPLQDRHQLSPPPLEDFAGIFCSLRAALYILSFTLPLCPSP